MFLKLLAICFIGLTMVAANGAHAANPIVIIETSLGKIKVELYEDKAPITVKNFLAYTEDKFYDGTIFHRVMGKENSGRDFMIQGGGHTPDLKEKETTKKSIKNESANGLSNARGTIAMARTGDPDSATCQFYINVANNDGLDKANDEAGHGYCVFGRVIEGMEIVDKIKAVPTVKRGGQGNLPKEDIVIKSVRVEKNAK